MIGVLGGMGPSATVDFFSKVLAATPAKGDADHVPLLIQSDPRIAPRPPAILGTGRSPLPELLAGRDRLIEAGATVLAMPCNTAHYWYADLLVGCRVPFLSIVEASCAEVALLVPAGSSVAVIGTQATLAARVFDGPLERAGFKPLVPDPASMEALVLPGIERVKAGALEEGGRLLEQAVQALFQRGSQAVVLACTEIPLALDAVRSPLRTHCIDTTAALARCCVAWWRSNP